MQVKIKPVLLHNFHLPMTPLLLLLLEKKNEKQTQLVRDTHWIHEKEEKNLKSSKHSRSPPRDSHSLYCLCDVKHLLFSLFFFFRCFFVVALQSPLLLCYVYAIVYHSYIFVMIVQFLLLTISMNVCKVSVRSIILEWDSIRIKTDWKYRSQFSFDLQF